MMLVIYRLKKDLDDYFFDFFESTHLPLIDRLCHLSLAFIVTLQFYYYHVNDISNKPVCEKIGVLYIHTSLAICNSKSIIQLIRHFNINIQSNQFYSNSSDFES